MGDGYNTNENVNECLIACKLRNCSQRAQEQSRSGELGSLGLNVGEANRGGSVETTKLKGMGNAYNSTGELRI